MLIRFWLSQTRPVTLRIQEQVFSGCVVPPDSKETKLGISDQEASPSAGKNTMIVLVPCSGMEVNPYSYFLVVPATRRRRDIKIPFCLSTPMWKSHAQVRFFRFRPEIPFLGKFSPIYQNCQFKLKFGT